MDSTTFSQSEQEVGKWIDGSMIYRKTLHLGKITAGTTKSFAMPEVKDFLGLGFPSFGVVTNNYVSIPRAHKDTIGNQNDYVFFGNDKRLDIRMGASGPIDDGYVTAFYTKNQ